MKNYEKESLVKNFLVFFSLLTILLILLFIQLYQTEKSEYKHQLLQEMRLCSYSLACEKFTFDFAPQKENILDTLYENNATYAYFTIPKSQKYYMKIGYNQEKLKGDINKIVQTLWMQFALISFFLLVLALFFTFYSLSPIRKALRLNDEFIKDILHDFNTPITAMILNIKIFNDEQGEDAYISRISKSIDTMILLQNNLKSFLHHSPSQNQEIDISKLVEERIHNMENMFPKLTFSFEKKHSMVKYTNVELLTRILDNLLSNASKYNKPRGKVILKIETERIIIKDTGKGIKDVHKVFQRYYKEQDRGIGLGMHIVQKLCNELNINIEIESQIAVGTIVTLDLKALKKE